MQNLSAYNCYGDDARMQIGNKTSKLEVCAIYVHWPFCLSLCPYCDFNSHIISEVNHATWSKSYIKELEFFAREIENKRISSIFFGGGTPSLMDPRIVESIIDYISQRFTLDPNAEISLEANPGAVDSTRFTGYQKAGVNRLSIGVQSFVDEDLKLLGRKHDSKEAIKAIEIAAKIFDNYSFDLIYARPNQTMESWKTELSLAISCAAKHLSLYQLTIEKGTPFYKLHKEGKLIMPEETLSADMMHLTNEMMKEQNFERYEISNYAKKSFECSHNLSYWEYKDYVGIGPGAHSRIGSRAIMTHHHPSKWLKKVQEDGAAIQTNHLLHNEEIITEMIMMGLRIKKGINKQDFFIKTGKNLHQCISDRYLSFFKSHGVLLDSEDYLAPSNEGMNIHSYMVSRLI